MSITGRNFGNANEVAVKIAGSLCPQPILKDMHSRITCQIPEAPANGKTTNLRVAVCVGGQWSDSDNPAATFSYRG